MKIINKPVKEIKKIFYHGRITKFRRLATYMIIGGLLASALYFCRFAFLQSAVSKAHVVMSYPEIAQSQYPDGSRFTYYDFISDDRLTEALEIMQKDGKYKYYTVSDLRDCFLVYSYLDKSASSNVSEARSEGNDFSYVANEYRITFIQPHDFKNPNIFVKLFSPNYSDKFLTTLMEVNRKYISEVKGGIMGFETIAKIDDIDNYDYEEKLSVYRLKKDCIYRYLDNLEKKAGKFKSSDNYTIKDIKGKYSLLISNKIDSIYNYINSSGLSKNPEVTTNKIKVNIEQKTQSYEESLDQAQITQFAITNYDQTFTENLINVVRDKSQGLYQARPKTSFDEVVSKNNGIKERVSNYSVDINKLYQDYDRYMYAPQLEDSDRQYKKCDKLFKELDDEYATLTTTATSVVTECLNEVNEEFLTAKVSKKGLISGSLVKKEGVAFLIGMLLMFIICIAASVISDNRELRRKKKLLDMIKSTEEGE